MAVKPIPEGYRTVTPYLIVQDDFQEWLSLALELWPDYSSDEMEASLTNLLHSDREHRWAIQPQKHLVFS